MSNFKPSEYYVSYSGLNKLLYSPVLFYNHYVLGEKEDKLDSYMVEGRLTHCLLYQEEEFNNQFIIAMDKLPSDNVKIIIDKLCKLYPDVSNLDDLKNEILVLMQEMNYHQSLKTDEQRLNKILTEDTKIYHEFVLNSLSKTVIDNNTYIKIKSVTDKIKEDLEIKNVLCLDKTEFDTHLEVYNELYLEYKLDNYSFAGIKGFIDNLVINHNDKKVYINDVKTTGKTLLDFKETIDYYKYWLQMGIYHMLTKKYLKDKNLDYEINLNFVVIDKYNQYYVFPVSEMTIKEWLMNTLLSLKIADYHMKNEDYSLPYALLKEKMWL